jgi:hypothetical protein
MSNLRQAIDNLFAFLQARKSICHTDLNQFQSLDLQVFQSAAAHGLLPALPQQADVERPSTDPSINLPPVQFLGKVNLPGHWLDSSGRQVSALTPACERHFCFIAAARWKEVMVALRAQALDNTASHKPIDPARLREKLNRIGIDPSPDELARIADFCSLNPKPSNNGPAPESAEQAVDKILTHLRQLNEIAIGGARKPNDASERLVTDWRDAELAALQRRRSMLKNWYETRAIVVRGDAGRAGVIFANRPANSAISWLIEACDRVTQFMENWPRNWDEATYAKLAGALNLCTETVEKISAEANYELTKSGYDPPKPVQFNVPPGAVKASPDGFSYVIEAPGSLVDKMEREREADRKAGRDAFIDAAAKLAQQQGDASPPTPPSAESTLIPTSDIRPKPREMLVGWHSITVALDMTHSDRNSIKRLNESFEGPIKNHGRGTKPMVFRDDLIQWWNALALRQQELANQAAGKKGATDAQHNYGREGTVVPEIGGSVKKRRASKPT